MSEPFRDALAAALEATEARTRGNTEAERQWAAYQPKRAERIIAALPPEWRDYLAAREPLLALVAAVIPVMEWATMAAAKGSVLAEDTDRAFAALADPAIVKLREAGRG